MSYYYTREMAARDQEIYQARYSKLLDVLKPFADKPFREVGRQMQKALAVFMQSCDTPMPRTNKGCWADGQTPLSPWIAFVEEDPQTGLCLWKYCKRY